MAKRYIAWLVLSLALIGSMIVFGGCVPSQSTGEVIHVKTSDFLTPKVKPAVTPVVAPPVDPPNTIVTYDPLRVPSEDDPYAPPARVVLPKSNPPLTNSELLSDCPSGRCGSPGYGPRYIVRPEGTYEINDGEATYSERGERRGLFGRWRR